MKPAAFIARRLRFAEPLTVAAIAISFLVVTVSVAVAGGFRHEVREAVRALAGDVTVENPDSTDLAPVLAVPGVESAVPVITMSGIIKAGDNIQGVLFKGSGPADSIAMGVRIPSRLASMMGLSEGDAMLAYFVGEKVSARRFTVTGIYETLLDGDGDLTVLTSFDALSRINRDEDSWADALEVRLSPAYRDRLSARLKAFEISDAADLYATSVADSYPQLFDWLDLVDSNVYAILLLMALVAGFNMISGLLILLFRNVATIGALKSMGMTSRAIAGVFLRLSARLVGLGMLIGSGVALLFCAVQGSTHILKLDPVNYFVSYVPVRLDVPGMLAADALVFVVIMLLLALPSMFISKVDPARTMRVE